MLVIHPCGLDWNMVDDLPLFNAALIQAEAQWYKGRFSPAEEEKQWNIKFQLAFSLCGRLIHDFHFAYRNEPHLIKSIGKISETSRHASVIQDLNDLAVLGKANRQPLQVLKLPMDSWTLLQKLRQKWPPYWHRKAV
jgi:hypothetical protein